MRLSFVLPAFMAALVVCLPNPVVTGTAETNEPVLDIAQLNEQVKTLPHGATIYKNPHLLGVRHPDDYTYIPGGQGGAFCADMSNLYGNWDNATRSLSVSAGHRCCFHRVPGCKGDRSKDEVLDLGEKGRSVVRRTLSGVWDRGIRSAVCVPL